MHNLWIFNRYRAQLNKIIEQIACTIKVLNCRFPDPVEISLVADPEVMCGAGTVVITATVSGCDNTYQWQENIEGEWVDIEGETQLSFSDQLSDIGEYSYRLEVTQCNGGIVYSEEIVVAVTEIDFQVFISVDFTEICVGGSIQLYSELVDLSFVPISSEGATYQYQVSYDNMATWEDIVGATEAESTYNHDGDVDDIDTVIYFRLLATLDGCTAASAPDAWPVTINEDPVVFIFPEENSFCEGGYTTLHSEVLGGSGGNNYQWQYLDGDTWIDIFGANGADLSTDNVNDIPAINPPITPGVYQFRLKVTQNSGCETISEPLTITVVADPVITISTPDTTICVGDTFAFTTLVEGGVGDSFYQWEIFNHPTAPGEWIEIFGEQNDTLTWDPEVQGWLFADTYSFRARVVQNAGCDSFSNEIEITLSSTGACLGNIGGTVFTNLGVPISGANVLLFEDFDHNNSAGTQVKSVFTTAGGEFAMASLPPGWYLMVLNLPLHTMTGATDAADIGPPSGDPVVDSFTILPNNNIAGREAISIRVKGGLVQGRINLIATLD